MASSKRKAYCVFGCSDLGAYMHRFPHPERRAEMFNTWLSIVGEKIKQTDRLRIYKNKRICNYHFKPEHKVASHRLLNSAVPSLHLSGIFSSFEISVQLEHNYSLPRMWPTNEKPEVDTLTPGPSDNACVTPGPSDNARVTPGPSDNARGLHNQHSSDEGQHKRSSAYFLKRYKASQRENRKLKAQLRKTMRKQMNYKTRLANAEKLVAGQAFDKVTKNMTLAGKIFTGMQYRQAKKKPKGRRFTIEEKVMALSFFKRSPKLYTLLYKHFALPSSKSLKIVLSQIKLSAGINKVIFEKLKDTVSGMNENDRLCTLIFDEMSLTPNIQYDCNNDELKGFVSHNDKMNVANHALVFMIKGIKMNYKQPVAYFFTQSLQKDDLKKILIEVIRHVHATGLKILCVVCDQAATNVSTLSSLVEDTKMKYLRKGKEWRREMFEVDSQEIIPLYDVPHLIKGVRNNLLTKDMIYTDFNDENKSKTVKWEYFQMLYEADKSYGELRYLHKLTEEHVKPDKIKKMRVKMAAQVFSHSVAVATEHLTARKNLPEECRQLIPMVLLFDKLFDSLNAGSFHIINGKIYRAGVKKNSPHHKLWQEGIRFLKNIKFITKKKEGDKIRFVETSVPSIKNFIKTIEGIQALWNILHKKYDIDIMLTRNFNQDPVENFFGSIRSLGVRNVNPNSRGFESSFKTLLINNLSSAQAINANCEEDINNCLQNIDFFIKEKETLKKYTGQDVQEPNDNIEIKEKMFETLCNVVVDDPSDHQQRKYVCGWVLKKSLSKIVKTCKTCRSSLLSDKNDAGNEYTKAKEYNQKKHWLCYPSNALANCFNEIQDITTTYLRTNIKKQNIRENIKLFTDSFVIFPCNCDHHKESLQKYFTDTSINILIYSWCKSINRILSGKITYNENDDPIKKSAQVYYNKHKNYKK